MYTFKKKKKFNNFTRIQLLAPLAGSEKLLYNLTLWLARVFLTRNMQIY